MALAILWAGVSETTLILGFGVMKLDVLGRCVAFRAPNTLTCLPTTAGRGKVGAKDSAQRLPDSPTMLAVALPEPKILGSV